MKTALILPGGGSKGAIEVGACRVLLRKVVPDVIISTSVGALNGVTLANGKDIEENLARLELIWKKANRRDFFPYNKSLFLKFHHAKSIYSNKGLYKKLKKNISVRTFEELDIPFYVNCTNMISGETEFFSSGKLLDPIVATCSSPPFFPPVYIKDIPYIDGSVSSYFGIREAIKLKCKQIIIINIRAFKKFIYEKKNLAEYSDHISVLLANQLIKDEIQIGKNLGAKIVEIKALSGNIHFTDFRHTNELIKEGENAAKKVMRKIR